MSKKRTRQNEKEGDRELEYIIRTTQLKRKVNRRKES
jgi:hypothetical protein